MAEQASNPSECESTARCAKKMTISTALPLFASPRPPEMFCLSDMHSAAIVNFWDFHCHNLSEACSGLKIHATTLTPSFGQVGRPFGAGRSLARKRYFFKKFFNVSPHKNICYSQSLSINLQQKYGRSLQGRTEQDILLVLLYMPHTRNFV